MFASFYNWPNPPGESVLSRIESLTIRAKFIANPGTHFVIRREAYRRITEALNEQGIYYAHRKVIVDFPDTPPAETVDEETRKKLMQAGAASTLALDGGDQQAAADSDSAK